MFERFCESVSGQPGMVDNASLSVDFFTTYPFDRADAAEKDRNNVDDAAEGAEAEVCANYKIEAADERSVIGV